MPFSCSKFSLFFERVDTISEGATLDCSNGVFRHYDEKTHLCLIHKKRPLLCRVAAYYDALQSTKLSREEWYWLNEEAIRRLQEEGTTKMGSIINVGVRKYSFLTPFLHKKVDIDGIHSYN